MGLQAPKTLSKSKAKAKSKNSPTRAKRFVAARAAAGAGIMHSRPRLTVLDWLDCLQDGGIAVMNPNA